MFDIVRFPIAACLMLVLSCSAAAAARAVLLESGLPGDNPALVRSVENELRQAGYEVRVVGADDICSAENLSSADTDLLVLPNAAALPAKSTGPIDSFLKGGGDIIALNAPLWQTAYLKIGGQWVTRDQFQKERASVPAPNVLFDFKTGAASDWHRSSDNEKEPSSIEITDEGPAPGWRSMHVVIPNLTSWDTYASHEFTQPFPKGHTLTVFSAKGGPATSQLAVEWVEKDGSRWIAVVPLYPEWRQFVLTPEDFKYWNSTPNRGFRGDRFKPENAVRMSVGMAHTHMGGSVLGRHEYWVSTFGTAQMTPEYEEMLGAFDPPRLDILSPGYKFFDSTGVASLKVRDDQAILADVKLPLAQVIRSPHPRPGGGGLNKGRSWRYIPLVQAETGEGEWRGTPVTMVANTDGPYKGSVWASFAIGDIEWYKTGEALGIVRQIAAKMREGAFILDAGANFYTYFEDQDITLGVNAANLGKTTRTARARITLVESVPETKPVGLPDSHTINIEMKPAEPGETTGDSVTFTPKKWPEGGYIATSELILDGKVVDKVRHEVNVFRPKKTKHFVTIKDGEFMLDGKRWRAHGINYMPSSGIATEDGEYFEHYIGARSYDPEIIQRDIDHMKDLGYNAVSVFIYIGHHTAQNLVDLLRRLDLAGMKADVSLRPGTPMDFRWPQIGEMITHLRPRDNDTVVAYDLAWEPTYGHHRDRVIWDGEWEKWIIERYGSIEAAEKDWGFPVPRDESGKVTNPLPHQTETDGEWRVMTAAYRRFLDTLLYKKYAEARRLVREIDPNHHVSFRMSEAGNPIYRWEGRIPYDFPYLAGAVDFLAPEAYGRIGDNWERVKPGWFEFEYARWAAPRKPMVWKEQGVSTWDNSQMRNTRDKLEYQARFYEQWYQMLIKSGADGLYSWFYPGGFRYGENSDYGVINPDGSDRPVSKVIRRYADQYINGPSSKPIDFWITIDRDRYCDGLAGIYDAAKDPFWNAIKQGLAPGLRTEGTGTDSSDCPLIAVGNVPCNGTNPPKYLDAVFDVVQVQNADGNWSRVKSGDTVKLRPGDPLRVRVEFTNLGEAKLLPATNQKREGTVCILATVDGVESRVVLPSGAIEHLASGKASFVTRGASADRPAEVVFTFEAIGRTRFGEKFRLTVEPIQ